MTVNVTASPDSPIASNNGPIEPGQTLELFASTVPGATYSSSGPNGFSSTVQNPVIPSATVAAGGVYTAVAIAGGCASAGSTTTVSILDPGSFYTVAPCRLLDTRNAIGPYGGPSLVAGGNRGFVLAGQCAISPTAKAVSINVTAINRGTGPGFLTVYPGATTRPNTSTIKSNAGQTRANNAIAPLGPAGGVTIFCGQASGSSDVVIDVNGYFE